MGCTSQSEDLIFDQGGDPTLVETEEGLCLIGAINNC